MFEQARLQLTLWYITIIMAVSLFFSSLVYFISLRELNRQSFRWERQLMHNQRVWEQMMGRKLTNDFDDVAELKDKIIYQGKRNLIVSLIYLNGLIVLIAGASGWFLAGKTLEPIQFNMESQKLFIANAAHELKTPLAIMQTNLELALNDNKLNPSVKAMLTDNLEEVGRLTTLVRQLLNLFTPPASIGYQTTDLKPLVSQTAKRFTRLAKKKGVSLKLKLTSAKANIIPDQIETALGAIIDNAIKYTPKGGQIKLELTRSGKQINIIVNDTGPGIKLDQVHLITQPFYKVGRARTRSSSDSFGLGLAIANKIVADHRGRLKIDSRPGQGTSIILSLPTA